MNSGQPDRAFTGARGSDWLIYQLADSLLPTGGFVCSAGLEAAAQHGWVSNEMQLYSWCSASVHGYVHTSLPFLDAAFTIALAGGEDAEEAQEDVLSNEVDDLPVVGIWCSGHWWQSSEEDGFLATDAVTSDNGDQMQQQMAGASGRQAKVEHGSRWRRLLRLDDACDASITSTVARRSSQAQGRALITAYVRCFSIGVDAAPLATTPEIRRAEALLQRLLRAIRLDIAVGHLAITFGIACAAMGLALDRARHLFVFLYTRNLLSAAVRLNLVGPYRAQRLLSQLAVQADTAIDRHTRYTNAAVNSGLNSVASMAQTAPLLDLFQGAHDRLYSRLFNS